MTSIGEISFAMILRWMAEALMYVMLSIFLSLNESNSFKRRNITAAP